MQKFYTVYKIYKSNVHARFTFVSTLLPTSAITHTKDVNTTCFFIYFFFFVRVSLFSGDAGRTWWEKSHNFNFLLGTFQLGVDPKLSNKDELVGERNISV